MSKNNGNIGQNPLTGREGEMSKSRMVFYGAMGSLVSVLIWSFIGGCHTSSAPDPAPQPMKPIIRNEAPPPPVAEKTLIEEGIIVGKKSDPVVEPVKKSAVAVPAAVAPRIHVVAKGDTLWGISRQYRVTVSAIEEANKLADPGRLTIGQQLAIP